MGGANISYVIQPIVFSASVCGGCSAPIQPEAEEKKNRHMLTVSKQHLIDQWSDQADGEQQVERWPFTHQNESGASRRKSQNKKRFMLHLEMGMLLK